MTKRNYAIKKLHRAIKRAIEWSNIIGAEAKEIKAILVDAEDVARKVRYERHSDNPS